MKNRIASLSLIAAALLAPTTQVFAAPAGDYFDAKIDNVKALSDGTFSVNFDRYMCDITAAKNSSGGVDEDDYAVVASSAVGRDQIMSVAVSALLSGKTVRVFVTDPAALNAECTLRALMILK